MVTLKTLLRLPVFEGAQVIAGLSGVGRTVQFMDIAEVPDSQLWSRPAVFTLTTAYAFHGSTKALMAFLESLVKNEAAGLGIKLGRYLNELPEELCAYANQFHFPIVLLPAELRYTQAIRSVTAAILEDERNTLPNMDECLEKIILGGPSPKLFEPFEAAGLSMDTPVQILAIQQGRPKASLALAALKHSLEESEVIATAYTERETVLLIRYSPRLDKLSSQGGTLFSPDILIATGGKQRLEDLRTSYEEAAWTIRLLKLFDSSQGIHKFSDMGLFIPLLQGESSVQEAALRVLAPVLEYDNLHQSALLETLRTYISCGMDQKETASRLHLHRNSLRYRLAQIEALLSSDCFKGLSCLRLSIALTVYFHKQK